MNYHIEYFSTCGDGDKPELIMEQKVAINHNGPAERSFAQALLLYGLSRPPQDCSKITVFAEIPVDLVDKEDVKLIEMISVNIPK